MHRGTRVVFFVWVALAAASVASCGALYGADPGTSGGVPEGGGAVQDATNDVADTTVAARDAMVADTSPPEPAFVVIGTGADDPSHVGLSPTHVYYTSAAGSAVYRCLRAGCGAAAELVASSQSVPAGLTVAGGAVIWATGYQFLVSCSVTAVMPCTPSVIHDFGSGQYPAHPVVHGTHLYWTAEAGAARSLMTCPVAGCDAPYPKTIYTSVAGQPLHGAPLTGLAVDGSFAYFASFLGGIVRLQFVDPETVTAASGIVLEPTPYITTSVELDGTTLRWTTPASGDVTRCAASNCAATAAPLLTGRSNPTGTASDATHVFGIDQGSGADGGGVVPNSGILWRLRKP